VLAILQQMTGINAVLYYAPTIFTAAGFGSASTAILATAGIGVVNVAVTVLALRLIDRLGRRVLLQWSFAGMAVALCVYAFAVMAGSASTMSRWSALASLAAYVGFFAIGLGPIFWLLIAEIFPLRVRGTAMSVATFTIWFFNVVSSLTFFQLLETFGQTGLFLGYAALTILGFWFVSARVPETKGLSLEQVERYWLERPDIATWRQ